MEDLIAGPQKQTGQNSDKSSQEVGDAHSHFHEGVVCTYGNAPLCCAGRFVGVKFGWRVCARRSIAVALITVLSCLSTAEGEVISKSTVIITDVLPLCLICDLKLIDVSVAASYCHGVLNR